MPDISREWRDGRWIYQAGEEAARKKQLEERSDWADKAAEIPSPEEAVDILDCFIRHPELDPEALARQLGARRRGITAAGIRNLLEHHGLGKKNAGYQAIRFGVCSAGNRPGRDWTGKMMHSADRASVQSRPGLFPGSAVHDGAGYQTHSG
jgi:hypothetical protein